VHRLISIRLQEFTAECRSQSAQVIWFAEVNFGGHHPCNFCLQDPASTRLGSAVIRSPVPDPTVIDPAKWLCQRNTNYLLKRFNISAGCEI
jgi:hypothetical protein